MVALAVSSGLGLMAWEQTKKAELNLATSIAHYSSSLFNEGKELDAFVEAIKAGKILQKQKAQDPEVMSVLHQNIYEGRERNRLEGHDNYVC
ncbi:MAG: hypothetical protein WBM32_08555 [Crocosphaera sp.]